MIQYCCDICKATTDTEYAQGWREVNLLGWSTVGERSQLQVCGNCWTTVHEAVKAQRLEKPVAAQ